MKFNILHRTALTGALACLALGFTACSDDDDEMKFTIQKPKPEPGTELNTNEVRVITTTSTRSKDLEEGHLSFSPNDNMSPSTIRLNPSETYQTMDGFGAAVTGATCFNLLRMAPDLRHEFLTKTFSPSEGYGFSYIRISIGCSDFALSEYTCCDRQGIENFALTNEETQYIIPILKEILAINPALKIMGTPWTAPRWMKVDNLTNLRPHNSWTGGQLNPAYYQDYGQYFVKWIQAFKAEGIDIYSVTPQNEPLNRGNTASMYMPWDQERDFVKLGLGPALRAAGLQTKVYAFDHNYNYDNIPDQKNYPLNIYGDADAKDYFAGAAYHNYGGDKNELAIVHNAAPGMDLVFTEASIGTWNDGRNLGRRLDEDMRELALGTVNRWAKGVIVWNLMLDENLGPNRPGGCQTCYGAVDINRSYTKITRNSHYYIIAHMSSVVKPGAVRIGTSGFTTSGLEYSAFKNTDGTYALVANNRNANEVQFTIDDGTHHFSYKMPANSAASFIW